MSKIGKNLLLSKLFSKIFEESIDKLKENYYLFNMESIKETLLKRLADLKARRFEALRRAGEPFAKEMLAIEKMLTVYEGEIGLGSELPKEGPVLPAKADLFSNVHDNLSPRDWTKRLGKTTQDMVLEILNDKPKGLSALNILEELNSRWSLGLVRTSLSPQISRLKQKGKLLYSDGLWSVPSTPSLGE